MNTLILYYLTFIASPVNMDLKNLELPENIKLRHSTGDVKLAESCFSELMFSRI
jgi:hypothetical protein